VKARAVGLVMFWIGVVYMVGASWLAMWWVAPIWGSVLPEELEGTIWAFGGPVFITLSLSVPVGLLLATLGILLCSRWGKADNRPFKAFAVGGVLVSLSMMYPSTHGYYPVVFGIAGGLIYLLFFSALWYWAKNRAMLDGLARTAADLQLASYVFFLLTASLMCALLGNPFSGLLFPYKVIQQHALPWHYCMSTKLVVYFVLGWLFTFLSQYTWCKCRSEQES